MAGFLSIPSLWCLQALQRKVIDKPGVAYPSLCCLQSGWSLSRWNQRKVPEWPTRLCGVYRVDGRNGILYARVEDLCFVVMLLCSVQLRFWTHIHTCKVGKDFKRVFLWHCLLFKPFITWSRLRGNSARSMRLTYRQLLTGDHLARGSMKTAANCVQ